MQQLTLDIEAGHTVYEQLSYKAEVMGQSCL